MYWQSGHILAIRTPTGNQETQQGHTYILAITGHILASKSGHLQSGHLLSGNQETQSGHTWQPRHLLANRTLIMGINLKF